MTHGSTYKTRMLLSVVPLDSPALPRADALVAALKSMGETPPDPATIQATENTLTFHLGRHTAAVALMNNPLPWENLEGPCATAWWWPEAAEKLRGHNSHLLVAMMGEGGELVERSLVLTRLTAAAAACVDTAAVLWGGGSLVHEPAVFLDEARRAAPDHLPLHLWIDFRVERNDDGSCRLFTTGMKALGRMEIEIPHSRRDPEDVANFAYSIADYILARGAEVRDGHTVGRSGDEKVTAVHAPSMWDKRMTVLRLDF